MYMYVMLLHVCVLIYNVCGCCLGNLSMDECNKVTCCPNLLVRFVLLGDSILLVTHKATEMKK